MIIWDVNEKMYVYMLLERIAFWEVIWQGIETLKMCTCFDPAISGTSLRMHAKVPLINICI